MRFGPVPLADADGALLAHGMTGAEGRLSKGTRLGAQEIAVLAAGGHAEVVVARLDPGDIDENAAATLIAAAIAPDHMRHAAAATGRLNLHATVDGLFVADRERVDRFNRIDPAITFACLADHVPVRSGDMVATIKIIPLAVARGQAERAATILAGAPAFAVKPFRACTVTLIATTLPALKAQVMDKTRRVLEGRLRRSGSRVAGEIRVAHEIDALARAIRNTADLDRPTGRGQGHEPGSMPSLIVIFGASAVTDEEDVIPAAIRRAGGVVDHVGMPVDPGNLLVLGRIGAIRIIGAPGCARSPKENGFDWVLDRILAGEDVGSQDITGLGVGGLLAEIPTRPRPRDASTGEENAVQRIEGDATPRSTTGQVSVRPVVLAAGRASRMGPDGHHKLLAEFDGVPLVRRIVSLAQRVSAEPVIVVTGHRAEDICDALSGLDPQIVHNEDYLSGMASSLITGLDAAEPDADGILVLLADMPAISGEDLSRLISAFTAQGGQAIVRAVSSGKRGNPVILPRRVFPALRRLEGDVGARHVIESGSVPVVDLDIGAAAHLDLDTPEAILAAGGVLTR